MVGSVKKEDCSVGQSRAGQKPDPISKITRENRAESMAQAEDHLHEAMSSNPSTCLTQKNTIILQK
jgi:hypothetical protein